MVRQKKDPKKILIEHNVPLRKKGKGEAKYPTIWDASGQMQQGDSVLFEDWYHAQALASYLKARGFWATVRVCRREDGKRLGWRVWKIQKSE